MATKLTADLRKKLIFGQANIKFGTEDIGIQADKAVFKAEPVYEDITVYDFGKGAVDKIVVGWNVTVDVVLATEEAVKFFPVSKVTNIAGDYFEDAAVGQSLRDAYGKKLVIHPRNAGADITRDITIHMAVPNGTYERAYGLEQGQVALSFTAVVKDDAEAGVAGNYFKIGAGTATTTP